MEEEFTDFIIQCPHCNENIMIEKLNCCIFRHGILKNSGKQINPHASKELCDFYVEKQLIFGCAGPFKVIPNENSQNNTDKFIAIICDYNE
jgi:hypothetical protein